MTPEERFRRIRISMGWTQREMADRLDRSLRQYQKYEYGEIKQERAKNRLMNDLEDILRKKGRLRE